MKTIHSRYDANEEDLDLSKPRDLDFKRILLCYRPLFEEAGSPFALACWMMLKNGEYVQYLNYEIRAENYSDATTFARDLQCLKLFSKAEFLNTGINKASVAAKEFLRCEQKCRKFNRRARYLGFLSSVKSETVPVFIRAREIISTIIGNVPRFEELSPHFGPGASVGTRNNKTSSYDKLAADGSITADLYTYGKDCLAMYPAWAASISGQNLDDVAGPFSPLSGVRIVPGSVLTFVPKNAKTDRPICTEPLHNGFWQKGVGSYLRKRLKAVGVDLDDQSRNQDLARLGSLTGDLATLDMKSASDLISFELVRELLPYDWFFMLSTLRSSSYTYKDVSGAVTAPIPFAKFSAMGNGFTFELESLIFYAICQAVKEISRSLFVVSVYGDDLIVPADCTALTITTLEEAGFEVSKSKSYTVGLFRESCGADYFDGINVRPYYMKKLNWVSLLRSHNKWVPYVNSGLQALCNNLKSLLPHTIRNYGPCGYGDNHLHTRIRPRRDKTNRVRSWDVVSFNTISVEAVKRYPNDTGARSHAYALYSKAYDARVPSVIQIGERVIKDIHTLRSLAIAASKDGGVDVTPIGDTRKGYFTRRDDIRYKKKRVHLSWIELPLLTW